MVLLLALFWPTVLKIEHHHEQFCSKAKNECHFHGFQEKCDICSFEFSVFSSSTEHFDLKADQPFDGYSDAYQKEFFPNNSNFYFSLRAPPEFLS
jgi:hypothetical protein